MNEEHSLYMQRAIQLAKIASGHTSPNPMVGAVLVYRNRIIGEGYHERYGEAHAEVNAINSVQAADHKFISESTLYVTLEPCSHYGKTPPCADLIIQNKIPRVVIGSIDPFPKVSGSGIEKLKNAGIEVITGIEKQNCAVLNKRFFTFYQKRRPYIILKWAQSKDGYIGLPGHKPVKISGTLTDRIVHKWRSEEAGILIGAGTALSDNPQLTNRLWTGKSPLRIVLDRNAKLPETLKLFNDNQPAVVYNLLKQNLKTGSTEWIKLPHSYSFIEDMLGDLFKRNILSIIIEGGATILNEFIKKDIWDEVRIITGNLYLKNGIPAPKFPLIPTKERSLNEDLISYFFNAS